jgi:Fe-S oxidoreductase
LQYSHSPHSLQHLQSELFPTAHGSSFLRSQGRVVEANFNKKESICCGGSLGSLALSKPERDAITKHSIESLTYNKPDTIVTACPLCYKTFSQLSGTPVKDIAQVTAENLV